MGSIQEFYSEHFRNFKNRFTQSQAKGITIESEQEEIIITEHKRAHRNAKENREHITERYYFPKMAEKTNKLVNCAELVKTKNMIVIQINLR